MKPLWLCLAALGAAYLLGLAYFWGRNGALENSVWLWPREFLRP